MTTKEAILTFAVDVSKTYRNKEGYDAGGYKLNTSFETEQHTVESFIEQVVKEGWPYTMAHQKRPPSETGADARGVVTPKHTENFTSAQLLTGDDDSQATGVVDFWLDDPFFSRYGLMFVESVNSKPNAEKGHPTLLFDRPVTDAELYKECLEALCHAYPRLDWLTNVDRTIYNAVDADIHYLDNVCPFGVFDREILQPYRQHKREEQAKYEAERQRRQAEYEAARQSGGTASDGSAEKYLAGYLRWVFDKVAETTKGQNRNRMIFWAGRDVAGIEAAPWAQPYLAALSDVDAAIVAAADANGYLSDHAHDDASEVLRIFNRGRAAGGKPLDPPAPLPRRQISSTPPPPVDERSLLQFKGDHAGHAECVRMLYPNRFCYTDGLGWLQYDGKRWTDKMAEIELEAAIKETLLQRRLAAVKADFEKLIAACSRNSGRIQGIKIVMRSDVPVYAGDLDSNPWLLNAANGTIDLRTGKLRPHDPSDYITKLTDVVYDSATTCAGWIKFLTEIFPKKDNDENSGPPLRDFIRRAVGYALTGSTKEQCLFFAHGGGSNGKTTFFEVILALLGDYGQKTTTEALMARNRYHGGATPYVARLQGARFVVAAELEQGRRLAESLVKDLTGSDTVTARFLNQNPFEFTPTHALFFYGNHKPEVRGTDDAIWRRIRLIPFLEKFEGDKADTDLPDDLKAELPGILAWAVRACLDWQKDGLKTPAAVTKATQKYRQEQDTLQRFIDACCVEGPAAKAEYKLLYNAYQRWGGDMTKRALGASLRDRGFEQRAGSSNVQYFHGLGLVAEDEKKEEYYHK